MNEYKYITYIDIGNHFFNILTNTARCEHCFFALKRLKTYLRVQ